MITTAMTDALNEQINRELYSSYLYLAMAAYCHSEGLAGMARWLELQAKEENGHADKLVHYLNERGARVRLKAIGEPPLDYDSPQGAFEKAFEHERHMSASIHALMDLAVKEKDFATQGMLQWFVGEQVEEERAAADVVAKFKMIGGDARGLYLLDRELGQRT